MSVSECEQVWCGVVWCGVCACMRVRERERQTNGERDKRERERETERAGAVFRVYGRAHTEVCFRYGCMYGGVSGLFQLWLHIWGVCGCVGEWGYVDEWMRGGM